MPLDGAQQVPPSEGQQPSAVALLQGVAQRGDGDAHTHGLVVLVAVHDHRHQVEVGHGEIHVHVLVDLFVGERHEAVEVAVGAVDDVEKFLAVVLLEHLAAREFLHVQVVAALHELGDTRVFLRHFVGHVHVVLHVVVVLFPSAHLLDVLGIVRIIVDGGHGAEFVESPREHAFRVHVGESQRSHHFLHAVLAAEVLNGLEQGGAHLDVVDEVDPSESDRLPSPFLVGPLVDDGCHAAGQFSVFIGEVIFCVAKVEGRVLLR